MSYEFGGCLYRCLDDMLDAIAWAWMTADGANHPTDVDEWVAEGAWSTFTRDCVEGWDLSRAYHPDDVSHMYRHGYTFDDLRGAFERFPARWSAEKLAREIEAADI